MRVLLLLLLLLLLCQVKAAYLQLRLCDEHAAGPQLQKQVQEELRQVLQEIKAIGEQRLLKQPRRGRHWAVIMGVVVVSAPQNAAAKVQGVKPLGEQRLPKQPRRGKRLIKHWVAMMCVCVVKCAHYGAAGRLDVQVQFLGSMGYLTVMQWCSSRTYRRGGSHAWPSSSAGVSYSQQ
jgi:hypothetical protein